MKRATTDDRTDEELVGRLQKIADDIGSLMKEIGPKLIKVSHLRKESEEIIATMKERAGGVGP